MKELVIISGKGGTGKTTITACFASLFENKVMADADVDAADLFILLDPDVKQKTEFRSGVVAQIDPELCVQCDVCRSLCRFEAITEDYRVDPVSCEGCGLCARMCPEEAVELKETVSGEWYVSDTDYGPFVHARLGVGEENSGETRDRRPAQRQASGRRTGPGMDYRRRSAGDRVSGHRFHYGSGCGLDRHGTHPVRRSRYEAGGRARRVLSNPDGRLYQQMGPESRK